MSVLSVRRLQGLGGAGPLVGALPGVVVRSRPRGQVLLQVIEPHGQRVAVVEGGGGVDEGVGQQLATLLHEQAALDGVAQDLLQQVHVFTLGFAVARLQQGQMG